MALPYGPHATERRTAWQRLPVAARTCVRCGRMPRMRPIILILFLSACSGVQGIPVAPRPPAFNPVLDSPITTGQPGYIGSPERAPRGTDKRVLPPTREPGIWAADKSKGAPVSVVVGGVTILLPSLEDLDPTPALECARRLKAGADLDGGVVQKALNSMAANERRCLVATAFLKCLHDRTALEGEDAPREWRLGMMAAIADATAVHGTVCSEESFTPGVMARAKQWSDAERAAVKRGLN